jgi:hypothetical protein
MTLQRRRQRNADIFDTGPFAGYTAFGKVDDGGDTGGGTNEQQADTSSANAVVWSYSNKLLTYYETYNILMNDYNFSDNDIWDMLGPNPDTGGTETQSMLDAYAESLLEKNAPDVRPEPYVDPSQPFMMHNVGSATRANQKISGRNKHYWSGKMEDHRWDLHGGSVTKLTTGLNPITQKYERIYPKPIVDAIGGYAMSISHYIARYSNDNTQFYGFEALAATEAENGIPAGYPIITVMQMFVKPGYDDEGDDLSDDILQTFEKLPVWRFANQMRMDPDSFFLLEPEIATENKLPKNPSISEITVDRPGWKFWKAVSLTSLSDMQKTEDVGYLDRLGIFKKSANVNSQDALDREFISGRRFLGLLPKSKDKLQYAAKVEWLGDDGSFGEFSKHPEGIQDCNDWGKTMVCYRFPRQLDPTVPADKEWLDTNEKFGLPDYSLTKTKYCYPHPRSEADTTGYALIGRLPPKGTTSDAIGADKVEYKVGEQVFTGRRTIRFVPMVSAYTHDFSCYKVNKGMKGAIGSPTFEKYIDRFCFDTTSVPGAAVSCADPMKKAYFESAEIKAAYFVHGDFDTGSTAFMVGQCLLNYEQGLIDANLNHPDPAKYRIPSSERIIISKNQNSVSTNMRVVPDIINNPEATFNSHEVAPRQTALNGEGAGTEIADYLVPLAALTDADLQGDHNPVGLPVIRDTYKEITGKELGPGFFEELSRLRNKGTMWRNQMAQYPGRYTYGGYNFPYTILVFQIPGYYKGPVIKYDSEGKPIPASNEVTYDDKGFALSGPGFIGEGDQTYMIYQTPFGTKNTQPVDYYQKIQVQGDQDLPSTLVDPDAEWDPSVNTTGTGHDIMEAQQTYAAEQEAIKQELLDKYGDVRWTSTPFKQHFHLWNEDYVTGKMLIEKGFKLPGVDYTEYDARLKAAEENFNATANNPETVAMDQQTTDLLGLGAFTNPHGFTVTDVTAKWGATNAARDRYTGDVGMSMVPYNANVKNEQLGYMAMSNLSGLGGPLDDAKEFGKDVTLEAAKWSGLGVGLGLGGAVIMLAGGVAVSIAAKGAGEAVWTIINKKKPNSI